MSSLGKHFLSAVLLLVFGMPALWADETFKVHGIFRSNMVLQRDKPIRIWGFAKPGDSVRVTLGDLAEESPAIAYRNPYGNWSVTFDPQPANTTGQSLVVECGDQRIEMSNILIGDIWVMNGQSNMAFALKAVYEAQFEASMAHIPLMRHIRINAGAESEHEETDLADEFINGNSADKNWQMVTPEVALEMGAIGYFFGSRLQRSLQVPIGIIDNARGGASLESLVPRHKFAEDPLATEYLKWVDQRNAEFSEEDFLQAQMDRWQQNHDKWKAQVAADKVKGK
ncbi:MAG: hypothetical protein VXZ82_15555 [Planctomycetota bacterium]|nr:hypothetical protein [Planctomycetota bacterium]